MCNPDEAAKDVAELASLVRRTCRRRVKDEDVAMDVAQSVLLKLVVRDRLADFVRGGHMFEHRERYLARCIKNTLFGIVRQRAKHPTLESHLTTKENESPFDNLPARGPDPAALTANVEAAERILALVEELDRPLIPILRRMMNGSSRRAACLGLIPETSFRRRLSRVLSDPRARRLELELFP